MKFVLTCEEGMANIREQQQTRIQTDNEFSRYISSMEAMWHILGLQSYPASNPPVKEIKVHLPTPQQLQRQQEGKISELVKYLNRPPALHQLKYTELYEQYIVSKTREAARTVDQPELQANIEGTVFYYRHRITPLFAR